MHPDDDINRIILDDKKRAFNESCKNLADSPLGQFVGAAVKKGLSRLSRKIFGNTLLQKIQQEEQNGDLSSSTWDFYIRKAKEENNREAEAYCQNKYEIAKRREAELRRQEELRREYEEEKRQKAADEKKRKEERKKLFFILLTLPIWLPIALPAAILYFIFKMLYIGLKHIGKAILWVISVFLRLLAFAAKYILKLIWFFFPVFCGIFIGTALSLLIFNWHEFLHHSFRYFQPAINQLSDSFDYINFKDLSPYWLGAMSVISCLGIWFLLKPHKNPVLKVAKKILIFCGIIVGGIQLYIHYHELPQVYQKTIVNLQLHLDSARLLFNRCPDHCIIKRIFSAIPSKQKTDNSEIFGRGYSATINGGTNFRENEREGHTP